MMRKGFALGLWIIPILVIIAVLSVRFLTDMYFSSSKSITSKSYEAFSTVNMAELYEKSLSESLQTMGKNVSYEIGKKGGGIEFWTPDISQEQIKAELEKAIKAELEKIKEIKIPGKNANIIFSPSEVKITPGSDWLASIEFTADVKKPFELNRSLQNINAFFNLKDSGDFKEKFPLAYFAMAEAGRKSFSDFKYSDSFDNGYSGQSGLKSLGTKSSLSHYSSCDCTCPYPSDQEMLSATEWSSIEPTITAIVNKINENMKKTYPYLVFDAKLSETHNKTWEIVSDSKSCPTSTICCGTCKSCSTDPETGEESCTTYCCDYGTECTASRTTTFKFKLNIVFTFFQIDKYSVVPFDGEQSGVFPVKINASFGNYDELEKKDLVDRVDCDNPYLPVWNIGGKWYAYGDSQPKEKFVLLAVDPQVDLTKQYKYVYCENGILINSVKGKATAEQKKESDDGVCAVTFGKENMGTKIGGSCSEEINNTYLIYTDGSSTEVSLSLNKKEFSTEIACYKSTFKYKYDNKQPIIGYSNE